MARYAIVKGTNVENLTEWDGDTNSWSPPTGTTAVALGDNPCGVGWTYADNKFSSPSSTLSTDEKWTRLRSFRNQLLDETDWWAVSDAPTMSDDQKNYRQSLRDLPSNTSDPSNPTWPTKP